jgi:N-acetylneuraminic acid mutarotase
MPKARDDVSHVVGETLPFIPKDLANILLDYVGFGRMIVSGGYARSSDPFNTIEVYQPAEDIWTLSNVKLSKARYGHAMAIYEHHLYVIGGSIAGSGDTASVEFWANGKWNPIAPLSISRYYAAAVVADGKLFVAGGYTRDGYSNTGEYYSSASGKWTPICPMISRRHAFPLVSHKGKTLYALGASSTADEQCESYDIATDKWTAMPPLPRAVIAHSAGICGNRMFTVSKSGVFEFDREANNWLTKSSMLHPRSGFNAAVADNLILVPGGTDHEISNSLEVYNSITDRWTSARPMHFNRAYFAAVFDDEGVLDSPTVH